jgi:hypothetical protein
MLRLTPVVLSFGALALASFMACGDNGSADSASTKSETGSGDGDPSGDGDGDGDPSGDGDGDGDTSGDGDGDGDTSGDGDGDPGCTPGELNCDCNAGLCLGDLECVDGTCVDGCLPGELGCTCNDGLCLGDLECVDDVCMDPDCIPGELGCTCNDGLCLGDLACEGNVCTEASGDGDGDGDPECPNPNEMMCNGQCIDVLNNDDNCGTCGHTCEAFSIYGGCEAGGCQPWFSECFQAGDFANCDEACGGEGLTCAFEGCDGGTAFLYGSPGNCDSITNGDVKIPPFCDEDFPIVDDWMRCCCSQD